MANKNNLQKLSWLNGIYCDSTKNPIRNITPIGIPMIFEFGIGNGYNHKKIISDHLEWLIKNKSKKYLEANAYLEGDFEEGSEYIVNDKDKVAVCYYKVE